MPNIQYYEDVKVLKKPAKKRIIASLKFLVFAGIIVLSIWVAKCLSAAITVGNLGAYIVYGDTQLKLASSSMYAITLGQYETFEDAERVGLGASIQGAGGFVWQDEKYFVVGSVYTNFADAEKVKENLKESNYNIGIKEIGFPAISIDFDMYENGDMGKISDAFETFDKVYSLIYDNSVLFDKGDISHLAVSNKLSALRGQVKGKIVAIQNLINKSSSKLTILQKYLIALDELLDNAIIKTIDNTATNYGLKYALTSCVRLKYDLFQELK